MFPSHKPKSGGTRSSSSTHGSLHATGLRKTYGKRTVVHDVSLSVDSGEVVGLLGPNGAGKTTSFYMIVGIVPRSEEHTSELQSLMRISYAFLCLKKKEHDINQQITTTHL